MHPILGIAVAIMGLAFERGWVIVRASSWNFGRLRADILKHVGRGDVSGAAPVGQVANAILTSSGRTEEDLYSSADAEASIVMPALARRLSYFALLANVATLLGLLGTIFGLITAFSAVGAADPSQRSQFLAKGISEAMNATAFGLLVAVPALLIHGFFTGRVERIAERMDEMSVAVVRALASARNRDHGHAPMQQQPAARPAAPAPSVSAPAHSGMPTHSGPPASGAGRVPVRNR
jgi:biopolymer transport protein ExbB/TolQ